MKVYDLPTVEATAEPMKQFSAPEVKDFASAQLQEQGAAVTKVGNAVTRIAQDLQDQIDTATTKDMDNRLADVIRTTLYDPEKGFLQTSGKNALDGRPTAIKTIQEATKTFEKGLTNDMQRQMFQKVASQRLQTALMLIDSHAMNQAKVYSGNEAKARFQGAMQDALQNWAGWEDPQSLYHTNKRIMLAEVDSVAELAGIPKDSEQYETLVKDATTQLHGNVITNMISLGQSSQAKKYFDAHIQEIQPGEPLNKIRNVVKAATTATEADDLAAKVWEDLGPKGLNDAIPLFSMTEKVRELAGDNEDVQKAAIAGIKERAGEWNGQQTETKAQAISSVWQQVDGGVSFKKIQTSPAWLALSGTERHEIRRAMEAEATNRANRAAANSSRELAELQRQEHLSFLKHGDEYLTVSDPNVLRKMSRAQVEATRTKFGMTATRQLLDRWDAIQNPGKYQEAKLDTDTFNAVARSLNLDPGSKNRNMRNQVGALKFRLEEALNHEMQQRKAPMSATEKTEFIRQTLSKQVLVNGFWSTRNKPIASLTSEDINKIVIPRKDQVDIAAAMAKRYKATGNEIYAPSRANLVRWYLKGKMPGYTDFYGEEND